MTQIAGIILAGGRASRMGGQDKALVELAGSRMIRHAVDRLAPQVSPIAISSNEGAERFEGFGLPVLADEDDRRPGPLAGVLAGMEWAAALTPPARAVVSVAVDTPFFPADLVARLAAASDGLTRIAMASSGGARHPTFALWPVALAEPLRRFIKGGTLKVGLFADSHGCTLVDFALSEGRDPFFNVNTQADLARAEAMAAP